MNDDTTIMTSYKTVQTRRSLLPEGLDRHVSEMAHLLEHVSINDDGAFLVMVENKKKDLIPLKNEFKVGRHRSNDLIVSEADISNMHSQISFDGDDWLIEDLDSRNGTFVNHERVSRRLLCSGDIIEFGNMHYVFVTN